jgi:hypothetical protein
MGKPRKPKVEPPHVPLSLMVETFCNPAFEVGRLACSRWVEPDCFNGAVYFRRYRVIAEEIAEPAEVLRERLVKLWRESNNHHDWQPLVAAAAEVDLTLDPKDFGANRRRK